ncbi:ankyrin repeat domain-containing protein [Halopseudomonas salina]|uniref:Ankyrin repeat domain-containing protein n=1 Tax=Halopseudomonas salina TaxID=1323744 RepID=A0ABQ1Q5E4_9GAMM|nr:ankyrin repeat domain-containing protein [Halopseudomonas salina]GGD12722.1 hypothetical protein GCM10007418_34490 [Halopseudomonas salina]
MLKFCRVILLMAMLSGVSSCAAGQKVGGMTPQQAFSEPLVAELVVAATQNNFEKMDEKVQAGVDVNTIGADGVTPLIWQVYLRNTRGAEKLLKLGADPNYRDEKLRVSALYLAVDANRVDLLDVLLRYKGDPNLIGPNGDSLLHQAVMRFCAECVRLLVEKYHANVNVQGSNGDTPANVAVGMGKFDLVVYFLQKGLNENLQNLALDVQIIKIPPESNGMKHKLQVIDMLKARGVQYPDPRYRPHQPPPGWKP